MSQQELLAKCIKKKKELKDLLPGLQVQLFKPSVVPAPGHPHKRLTSAYLPMSQMFTTKDFKYHLRGGKVRLIYSDAGMEAAYQKLVETEPKPKPKRLPLCMRGVTLQMLQRAHREIPGRTTREKVAALEDGGDAVAFPANLSFAEYMMASPEASSAEPVEGEERPSSAAPQEMGTAGEAIAYIIYSWDFDWSLMLSYLKKRLKSSRDRVWIDLVGYEKKVPNWRCLPEGGENWRRPHSPNVSRTCIHRTGYRYARQSS